jgi:hypothetical protein
VCRVLRNYYTDKGRPFPAWLPPDPKAPVPVVQQPMYVPPQVGSRYGGLSQGGAGAGSGFSSLWDSGPKQAPQQSLRAGRGGEDATARPLPSQRAGSYQNTAAAGVGGGAGAGSAQDRLKQRLWGAGRQSPGQTGSQFQPPGGSPDAERYAPGGGQYGGQGQGPGPGQGQARGGRPGLPSGPRGYR